MLTPRTLEKGEYPPTWLDENYWSRWQMDENAKCAFSFKSRSVLTHLKSHFKVVNRTIAQVIKWTRILSVHFPSGQEVY